MTVYLKNVKGSAEDMEKLFNDAKHLSIRYYKPAEKNKDNFDITIRCDEEMAKQIGKRRTLKPIMKLAF